MKNNHVRVGSLRELEAEGFAKFNPTTGKFKIVVDDDDVALPVAEWEEEEDQD